MTEILIGYLCDGDAYRRELAEKMRLAAEGREGNVNRTIYTLEQVIKAYEGGEVN